jgi:hypothetical protein
MIKILTGIYAVGLLIISAGWVMAIYEWSLPLALAAGVGMISVGLVVGGVTYVSITGKTDISVVSPGDALLTRLYAGVYEGFSGSGT